MQQQISIHNATINAFASFEFGQAVVVTNAAVHAPLPTQHAVSKCSDPGKSGGGSLARWRGTELLRGRRSMTRSSMVGLGVTVDPGRSYPMPAVVAMPPALWATWVLGQPLCG